MRSYDEYSLLSPEFWAVVRFISDNKGYTDRKTSTVLAFSADDIRKILRSGNTNADDDIVEKASNYTKLRAEVLNSHFQNMLMTADGAREEYEKLLPIHENGGFLVKLPLNKQSGEMKKVNYFTAIVNILAEKTLRESNLYNDSKTLPFDDDPRHLVYIKDSNDQLLASTSRRFDGAFPNTINPIAVWEIKEYYYATTFGSRIADGVYETQLDGYEFYRIEDRFGVHVDHIFFFDAYRTWWIQGKSYLCRIFDALHMGLVDEVIVGREALTRWPELLKEYIDKLQQEQFED